MTASLFDYRVLVTGDRTGSDERWRRPMAQQGRSDHRCGADPLAVEETLALFDRATMRTSGPTSRARIDDRPFSPAAK